MNKSASLDPRLSDLIDLLADIYVESLQKPPAEMSLFAVPIKDSFRRMSPAAVAGSDRT